MNVQFQVTTLREETPKGDSPNGKMFTRALHFDFIIEADNLIDAFAVGKARMMIELKDNGLSVADVSAQEGKP